MTPEAVERDRLFPPEITEPELPAFKVRWVLHGFEIVDTATLLAVIHEDLKCIVYERTQDGYVRPVYLDGTKLVVDALRETVERWFAERRA